MINIPSKIKYKNIKALYNIKEITINGTIVTENRKIQIYNVEPINVINSDKEFRMKIYSSYLSCIKNFNQIQIIIKTERKNFNDQIAFYKNRILQIESLELKKAIRKYIEYLEKQEGIENYLKKVYIVVNEVNISSMQDINNYINSLSEIGVKVTKISNLQEIRDVLRECILKEKNEAV